MKKTRLTMLLIILVLVAVSCGIPTLFYYDPNLMTHTPDTTANTDPSTYKGSFKFEQTLLPDGITNVFSPSGADENCPAIIYLYAIIPTNESNISKITDGLIAKFKSTYSSISSSSTISFSDNKNSICNYSISDSDDVYSLFPFSYSNSYGTKNFPYTISNKSYGASNKTQFDYSLVLNDGKFDLKYLGDNGSTEINKVVLSTYNGKSFLYRTGDDFNNVSDSESFQLIVFYAYNIRGNSFNNIHWSELKKLETFTIN